MSNSHYKFPKYLKRLMASTPRVRDVLVGVQKVDGELVEVHDAATRGQVRKMFIGAHIIEEDARRRGHDPMEAAVRDRKRGPDTGHKEVDGKKRSKKGRRNAEE